MAAWYVYVIECRDGSLYTGVARDVSQRVAAHNAGKGARYTRGRAPVRVVAKSRAMDKVAAYRLEWQVKRMPRQSKVTAVQPATARSKARP